MPLKFTRASHPHTPFENRENVCALLQGRTKSEMGGPSLKKYRLNLIGPFGLFHANGERIEISSKKAIALFALVAAAPNGERSRRWLAGAR